MPGILAFDMIKASGFDYLNVYNPHIVSHKNSLVLTFTPHLSASPFGSTNVKSSEH